MRKLRSQSVSAEQQVASQLLSEPDRRFKVGCGRVVRVGYQADFGAKPPLEKLKFGTLERLVVAVG